MFPSPAASAGQAARSTGTGATQEPPYDLLVIGGGINGCGIARDAADHGLSVCLVERDTYGCGTSSKSSKLAHGGLRYLEQFEFGLVHEALQDRERMLKEFPDIVTPLRFLYPIYPHVAARRTVRVGLLLYDILSHGKSLPKRGYLNRRRTLEVAPGLNEEGLVGAATYYDGLIDDVPEICRRLIAKAEAAGAKCHEQTKVTDLLIDDGVCQGALVEGPDGKRSIRARATVNAAGPWIDDLVVPHRSGKAPLIRKTKGIHVLVKRFMDDAVIVKNASDGRTFFFIPWRDYTVIGTTDTDFHGDARNAAADPGDIAYLLDAASWYFPDADLTVHGTYAGVRALVNQEGLTESNVTRRHIIHSHAPEGMAQLWSLQGGKITTYWSLSREVVQQVQQALD